MTFPTRSRLSLPRATGNKRTRRLASTGFHALARFCRCLQASCEAPLLQMTLFQVHVTGFMLLLALAEQLSQLNPPATFFPTPSVERGLCSCGFTRWKPRARNLILPGLAHPISHISLRCVCVERKTFSFGRHSPLLHERKMPQPALLRSWKERPTSLVETKKVGSFKCKDREERGKWKLNTLPPTATKSRAHSDIVQKRLEYTFAPWSAVAEWCHDGCQQE